MYLHVVRDNLTLPRLVKTLLSKLSFTRPSPGEGRGPRREKNINVGKMFAASCSPMFILREPSRFFIVCLVHFTCIDPSIMPVVLQWLWQVSIPSRVENDWTYLLDFCIHMPMPRQRVTSFCDCQARARTRYRPVSCNPLPRKMPAAIAA